MCGITGIAGGTPERRTEIVSRMNRAQRDRGPDGEGIWSGPAVTLGATRLAIVDLSEAGAQPMESESWALAYNGEIYNHRELRSDLAAAGQVFEGHSDTEVLLRALETWGVAEATERLNGMFAFAAWHKPTSTLHLVRDRLGIKPLCFFVDTGQLVFASTPAAIIRGVRRDWTVDRRAVARYLYLGAPFGEQALVDGIERLEPATILTFRKGQITTHRYWEPGPRQDALDELIEDAVTLRLYSDAPVALLMSGGLDSSLIARHAPGVLGFHLDAGVETTYARKAAETFGQDLAVVTPSVQDIDELMLQYVASCGEPSMACAAPALVARALRGEAKVCLSANGADELFLGYWRTLDPRQIWHVFRHELPLGPGYTHTLELPAHFSSLPDGFPSDAAPARQWFELNTYIRYDLNPVLDYGTMMFGVEARVPYLDHRVVERALTMPLAEKLDATLGDVEQGRKAPLKKLLGEYRSLWDRKKVGFSLPKSVLASEKKEGRIRAMVERGVVTSLQCSGPFAKRDAIYLANSLWSLGCWYEHWVEGGLVADEPS